MKLTSSRPQAARTRACGSALPLRSAIVLACLVLARAAAAQDVEADSTPSGKTALGIGVGSRDRPYADLDRDTRVLPLLAYDNAWLHVSGLGALIKLGTAGPVGLGLRVQYMQDGYKSSDSPVLAGMADRKAGVWLGPAAAWRNPWANLSLSVLGDISGHSQGLQTSLMADRTWRIGAVALTPHVGATWLDGKYVDYYYGVGPSEATPTRPSYAPGAAVNLSAGLRTTYMATSHQVLFLDVTGTRLGDQIRNSPLVDRSGVAGYQVGYLYRF